MECLLLIWRPFSLIHPSYSYLSSMQLLGLDEGQEGEEVPSDTVTARGAYLSLLYLRHLKIRELQVSFIQGDLRDCCWN
jgi:hypothetical protein